MIAKLPVLALAVGVALAAPSRTHSSPSVRRSDIPHDEVVGFNTTVADDTEGDLMLQWQPDLKVVDGCVPYPAVDAEGNTSSGLAPTGTSSGDCSSSTGQVYSRAGTYDDYYMIMYSWYMPKDEPNEIEGELGVGHRYDWENAVVVLSSESTNATLVGIAASYHGDYQVCSGTGCDDYLDGDTPLIRYYTAYGILDHSLGFTSIVGGTQPLIAWDELPTVSQEALTNKDWGSAIVPFLDSDFESYLEEAAEYLDL
ncbi:hypothetical protein SLS53_002224 [Cytospora paraplurivora]|uniref:Uncharacterized protein n=1 Tax=Cytospora paraplurivora TaxID=2898453 RepID=A0AAN9UDN7_9PEZI